MEIKIDDLTGSEIAHFIAEHVKEMEVVCPPDSQYALGVEGLRHSDITVWTIWNQGQLLGCGAIQVLNSHHAELKSMRTITPHLRTGIASKLLEHILAEAKLRGYQKISLETGSMPFFEPARKLYEKYGFQYCVPFGKYHEDPNSVFMTRNL